MSNNPSRGVVLEALGAVMQAIFKHFKAVTAPVICFALHPNFDKNLLFNGSGLCPDLDRFRAVCRYPDTVIAERRLHIFDHSFLVGGVRCIWEHPPELAGQACFLSSPEGIQEGFMGEMLARTNDILFNGEGDSLNETEATSAVIMMVLRPKRHPGFVRHVLARLRDSGKYKIERYENTTSTCGWVPRGCVAEFYLLVK